MTSSWFFLSTLNYDARSNAHQIYKSVYLLFCEFTLHVPGFNHTHHQEYSKLEEGSCTGTMTSTGGCSYSFVCSWWWVWWKPETRRVVFLIHTELRCTVNHTSKYFQFSGLSTMPRQLPVTERLYSADVRLKLLVLRTKWSSECEERRACTVFRISYDEHHWQKLLH